MQLYYRTRRASADAIVAGGFQDGQFGYLDPETQAFVVRCGVCLSEMPLDETAGWGETLLRVTLPDAGDAMAAFAIVRPGQHGREWCIPADVLNRVGRVEIIVDTGEV
jgi:hypothetical protein